MIFFVVNCICVYNSFMQEGVWATGPHYLTALRVWDPIYLFQKWFGTLQSWGWDRNYALKLWWWIPGQILEVSFLSWMTCSFPSKLLIWWSALIWSMTAFILTALQSWSAWLILSFLCIVTIVTSNRIPNYYLYWCAYNNFQYKMSDIEWQCYFLINS